MWQSQNKTHDPKLIQLVRRSGDMSLFRDADVSYFTLRNWVRHRGMHMNARQLLDCNTADLIIRNLQITAKYQVVEAKLKILLTVIKVFGFTVDWRR